MKQCQKCRDSLPENIGPDDIMICVCPPKPDPRLVNLMFIGMLTGSQSKANHLLRIFIRDVLEKNHPKVFLATASISLVADQVRLILNINTHVEGEFYEDMHEKDWQEQALLADERPITDLINLELLKAISKLPIPQPVEKVMIDIAARRSEGLGHHPESIKLMQEMQAVDKENNHAAGEMMDSDGDLGEHLMFLMDVVFEQRELVVRTGSPKPEK